MYVMVDDEQTRELEQILCEWKELNKRDAKIYDREKLDTLVKTVKWLDRELDHEIDLIEYEFNKIFKR